VRAALLTLLLAPLAACTTVVTGRATPPPIPEPCGSAGSPAAIVQCLARDVTAFWVRELPGTAVSEKFQAAPAAGDVPNNCRGGLALGTAFYCPPNATVYLTATLLARSSQAYGANLPYALAAVVGHEFGHAVQDAVHQPGFDAADLATSRRIEQQADCLLGVWAHDAAHRTLLTPALLRDIAGQEYTLVDGLPRPPDPHGYTERATHGTPAERVAALTRGLTTGTPTTCALAKPS
jgi:predicted metalloprotease